MRKYLVALILLISFTMIITCSPNDGSGWNGWSGDFPVKISPRNKFSDNAREELTITVSGEGVEEKNCSYYYTTDGSDPTEGSEECEDELEVKRPSGGGVVTVKVLVVDSGTGGKSIGEAKIAFGRYALDFVLQNHDGGAVVLSELGKEYEFLHVDFSSESCHWCKVQAGKMESIIKSIQNQGYSFESVTTVIGNATDGNPDLALIEEWHARYGMDYIVRDLNGGTMSAFTSEYGASSGIPHNVLLKWNASTEKYKEVASGFGIGSASDLTGLMN